MKALRTASLAILLFTFFSISDVAPPFGTGTQTHAVTRDIIITNTAALGAIRLIAGNRSVAMVTDGSSLGNSVQLLAVPDSVLTKAGGLQILTGNKIWDSAGTPVVSLNPGHLWMSKDYSLAAETFYYKIDTVADGKVKLRLTKRVLRYDDGGKDDIINY